MKRAEISNHIDSLDQDIKLVVYGEAGYPVIAFPTAGSDAFEWEQNGMIDAIADLIDDKKVQLFCVDSADAKSWLAASNDLEASSQVQEAYDHYVTNDLLALVKKTNGYDVRPLLVGCDLGATHALLGVLRWPDLFEGVIGLSGIYDAKCYTAGSLNSVWYDNSPVDFMANLPLDHPYVELLRKRFVALCSGQGNGEQTALETQRALDTSFAELSLDAWFDYWGFDVDHSWAWWTKQLAYFLPQALEQMPKLPAKKVKTAAAKKTSAAKTKVAAAKKVAPAKKTAAPKAAPKKAEAKVASAQKVSPAKKADDAKKESVSAKVSAKPVAKPAGKAAASSATAAKSTVAKATVKPVAKTPVSKPAAQSAAKTTTQTSAAKKPEVAKPVVKAATAKAVATSKSATVAKTAASKTAVKPASKQAKKK